MAPISKRPAPTAAPGPTPAQIAAAKRLQSAAAADGRQVPDKHAVEIARRYEPDLARGRFGKGG